MHLAATTIGFASSRLFPALAVSFLIAAAGCGSTDPTAQLAAINNTNIKRLANLYLTYQMQKGFIGPKDEATFRSFIQGAMPADKLQIMQIDPSRLDSLFASERDGRPFNIRYGLKGNLGTVLPVVFETEGNGGKRQVGFNNGSVEDVADDVRYKQLLEDPGRPTYHTQKTPPQNVPGS